MVAAEALETSRLSRCVALGVAYDGAPFAGFARQAESHVTTVQAGDPLLTFDRAKIREAGYDSTVIMVAGNGKDFPPFQMRPPQTVAAMRELKMAVNEKVQVLSTVEGSPD